MNRTHSALWGFGLAGMAAGISLTVFGFVGAGDVAGLAGGYGVLVIGSAAYLLAGMTLRDRLGRRAPVVATSTVVSHQS
jgi:hypothetical protein